MITSIIYLIFYIICGLKLSIMFFHNRGTCEKIWLGLIMGLLGMTWCPSLFAFITGRFGIFEHIAGCIFFLIIFILFYFFAAKKHISSLVQSHFTIGSALPLLAIFPIFLFGLFLFSTHVLQDKGGSLYVGQTTYGDLAMHLGFISGIATQGVFPPEYTIFPGHTINYPFLCEIPSASLYFMGTSLRLSYLIPAVYAFILVITGVYFFFRVWLKKPKRIILACFLFFFGGGLGFTYFLDGSNTSNLSTLLKDYYSTNISQLLNGYYTTPTNLPALGLRWVNPLVDMLIPQRATLFGWAFLFPCLKFLHEFTFEKESQSIYPLSVIAASLPLIHTHSFLALGVISAGYLIQDSILHFERRRFRMWLIYGFSVVIFSAPQLFGFAFKQAGESGMVKLHFNWANEQDSWIWFYLKNWGILFLSLIPGLILLSEKTRQILFAPILLWLISEIVVFQPNTYDNNKLIFVFFAYLCGLTAKLLSVGTNYLNIKIFKNRKFSFVYTRICFYISLFQLLFFIGISISGKSLNAHYLTLIFTSLLLLYFSIVNLIENRFKSSSLLLLIFALCETILIALVFVSQYDSLLLYIRGIDTLFIGGTILINTLFSAYLSFTSRNIDKKAGSYALCKFAGVCISIVLFLSGISTCWREAVSSYQAFSGNEVKCSEFIKNNTETNGVFLTTTDWHLNPVSVLSGRKIVCGPDLYLYYHGIDTSVRKNDVAQMFEHPEQCKELFSSYQVRYVYISGNERSSYSIDFNWYADNCLEIYNEDGILIYQL